MPLSELFFDPGPIVWVQQTLGLGWPFPFRVISLLGISWGVILALGVSLWLWGRQAAYSLAGIIVLEALVSMAMNRAFAVERPDAASIVKYEHVALGSFPSGHLFTATIVWGWLYASRRVPFAVPAAVVVGVATARLYLGVHFLGDVVGAAVFGAALVWVYARLWPRVQRWLAARPPRFFAALALGFAATGVLAALVLFPSNPYVANASGVLVAGPAALWAERRWVGYRAPAETRARVGVALLGLAGILPPLVVWWYAGEDARALSACATAAGTLWALLATPVLARRLSSGGGSAPAPARTERMTGSGQAPCAR
ncbi:MAG: phosphatase PAP2 family protein [Gemmatimonadetes bacterium]|nr:phosphatase PAP2 family protein [Gemmatimonadota bacterium]